MLDFKEIEEAMLEYWKKNKTYEKVKEKNKKGKPFYFLQGPPYTSGKIHIGHAWNNALKDMILRYKRMQGLDVWDRAGYDMHGLPTENAVQKKLKLKTKEEIIEKGMDVFIKECMDFAVKHAAYMNEDLRRFAVWLDFDNAYMPVTKDFVSGQWAFFKKAHEQDRLYKGSKVMHWDSVTETALAKHELEYKTVKDTSVFLKFKRKNTENEYFVIWTTTPWTIPYNLAIMANPDVDYVKIKVDEEYWILAKALVGVFMGSVVGKKFEIVEEFKGETLEGEEYEHFLEKEVPKFSELKKQWPNVHTIILSKQYVDTTSGSGLVHCAPGCGPEDEEAARSYGIQGYNSLTEQGEIGDGKLKGWKAKFEDDKFIKLFEDKKHLIATTKVEHEYPHSWRSHKPVVFRTTEQWFLKTADLAPRLLEHNKNVYWVPKSAGESYVRWSENLKDNSVTRQRFWGCPVPIWVNKEDPEDYIVIGSAEELTELTGKTFDDLSIHKPWIDDVIIERDGKTYKRIPDVSDVWIDSGTASWNCLYNDPELIKKYFPADLVLEATEQTRLWYSLLQICSSIMFDQTSYKNVYTHGMIFDFQGTKMSKSLGNIISPYEVVDKYSSDVFRYYICEITAGENISFNWEDVKQKQRNLLVLTNIGNYLMEMLDSLPQEPIPKERLGLEERYMLSKAHSTLAEVTELFEKYELDKTITKIEELFLDLSRVYIKITRDKSNGPDRDVVTKVICDTYLQCLTMFSPICPLATEHLWQQLKTKLELEESIHLADWPKYNIALIDEELEKSFEAGLEIIEKGLAARDSEKIGLKWPLAKATVTTETPIAREMAAIIAAQLNIKEVALTTKKDSSTSIVLDTKLTPELEAEGYAREVCRKIQAARKKAKLVKPDKITLAISADEEVLKRFVTFEEFIKERVNAVEIAYEEFKKKDYKHAHEDKIKEDKVSFYFSKIKK